MNHPKKNILITGATGSLGKQLLHDLVQAGASPIAHCRAGSDTRYIDSLNVEKRLADMRSPEQLAEMVQNVEAIIHTAAIVNFRADRLTQFIGVNTMGAVDLYRAARAAGVKRFVQVSSVAGVGARPRRLQSGMPGGLDESFEFNLGHLRIPYIMTKRAAEEALLAEAKVGGPELVIVNPSIMIAPSRSGDDRGRARRRLRFGWVPGLSNQINLVDIRDVSSGILAALEKGEANERYLLTGENIQVNDLVRQVGDRLDRNVRLFPLPITLCKGLAHVNVFRTAILNRGRLRFYPDLVRLLEYDWVYSSAKAKAELGFAPRPLDESLNDLLSNDFKGSWQS